MSTVTEVEDVQKALDQADPNKIADALRLIELGNILAVKEELITVSPAGTELSFLTDPAATEDQGPVLMVQSVEVISGAASAGSRRIVPSTDAASTTETVLDVAGETLTFEANVATVRVRWIKGPATALTEKFAPIS